MRRLYERMVTATLHRIINISNGTYLTKGDNNINDDYPRISFDEIEGKVVGVLY